MSPLPRRALLRAVTVTAVGGVLALVGAVPALAHVTAQPGTAQQGGYVVVTFRVPNEDDTAGTVGLTVTLPKDHPFSSVRTTPIPGWTATTQEIALNPPITKEGGATITKTVGSVTWKADPGTRIAPGQYLDFPLSLGPMPKNTDTLSFPAAQTYDNGQVVNWADPPNPDGSEAAHPAPSITLTAAAAGGKGSGGPTATATATDPPVDTTARWLGGAGLLVGALGLGIGGGALLRGRRRKVE